MAERQLIVKIIGDDTSLRRSFTGASRSSKDLERNLGSVSRGALAGSGVFRGLGRSIAFASGGFLAFASAGQFIRSSIDAAKEAVVTQRQLAAQFRASGQDLGAYQGEIDRTANRLSLLAGFENDQVKAAFVTIFRVTGDVGKALRDTGTAADFARAKHIDLTSAATLFAKVEGGNTTLLRRQGVQVAKNATVEQALAQVRAKFAGQAAAGTTAQERFGAVLHNTEEIIGGGILPVLNRYLASGSKWLEQMNESGKLQQDVSKATAGFASAMRDASTVVKDVDDVTGSFKNTLEVLAVLKLSSIATNVIGPIVGIGKAGRTSREEVALLRGSLLRLGAVGVITVGVELVIHRKSVDKSITNFLDQHGLGFFSGSDNLKGLNQSNIQAAIAQATKAHDSFTVSVLEKVADLFDKQFKGSTGSNAAAEAAAKAAHGIAVSAARAATAGSPTETARKVVTLTAEQRNTFFDNALTRDLDRVQDLGLQQQVTRLQQIRGLITRRIAATKDITRKLNLEDDLVDVQRRTKDVRSQIAQNIKDQIDAQNAAAKERLALVAARNQASQFKALGLSATGDRIIPVNVLKNELARLTKSVDGTLLDTKKTTSLFANIRKIFAGGFGAITAETKSQIKQMLDGIDQQLKDHTKSSQFKHLSSAVFAAAIPGLTAAQKRAVESAFSQTGRGGTIPGGRSAAFSSAGTSFVLPVTVELDGKVVAKNTTKHQQKARRSRSVPRRGPWAGHT